MLSFTLHISLLSLAIILGQFGRFQIPNLGTLYLHDLIIISWIAYLVVRHGEMFLTALKSSIKKIDRKLLALIGLLILLWISNWIRFDTLGLKGALYTFRLLSYLSWAVITWWWITSVASPGKTHFNRIQQQIITACSAIGGGVASLGLLQYLLLPDTRWLYYLGYDDHYFRLLSTQFDPNFTGILLVMFFFFIMHLQFFTTHLKALLLAGVLLAITLTFSRSSYLSLLLGTGCYALLSSNNLESTLKEFWNQARVIIVSASIAILLLTVGLIAFGPGGEGLHLLRTASISARVSHDTAILQSFDTVDFLIGRGLFTPLLAPERVLDIPHNAAQPNNIAIWIFNGLGLIGISILGLLTYFQWNYLTQIYNFSKENPFFSAVLAAVMTHSFFNLSLLQPFVLVYLLLLGIHTALTAQTAPRA